MTQKLPYKEIRNAAIVLAQTDESKRNRFLEHLSRELITHKKKILAANRADVRAAEKKGLAAAFVQRLVLDEHGFALLKRKLADVRKLKSGIGETISTSRERGGLILKKVRVPLGVLAVIYEARPEVTLDVAALCVKSGNAAILKGGSEALKTNAALYECISGALKKSGLPSASVAFIKTGDRSVTNELMGRHDVVDLVIARGSYGMVQAVMDRSTIPVLAHASGGARIFVDDTADQEAAVRILVNAKITKPAACNTVDTILVHKKIAKVFIPKIVAALIAKNVRVKGDVASMKFAKVEKASEKDWDTEYLGMAVSIKVVSGVEEAVVFTNAHSKRHTEGILSRTKKSIDYYLRSVDAAALFVNASTRLHDGFVFGLGSEMGISTAKLHARGPVGLKELTTYKWEVFGHGNIREN